MIKARYALINSEIEKELNDLQQSIHSSSEFENRIRSFNTVINIAESLSPCYVMKLETLHNLLCKVCDKVNETFSLRVLFSVTMHLITITGYLYFLFINYFYGLGIRFISPYI